MKPNPAADLTVSLPYHYLFFASSVFYYFNSYIRYDRLFDADVLYLTLLGSLYGRYEDLVDDADLTAVVERAFGREGLGIVAVTRVPDIGDFRREMMELGRRCLSWR